MSLIKQLAGETVLYGLGQILPRIFHYIVFSTYLTYRLNESPGEYAIYLDLYAYASVLIVVFSYRMDTAFFRFGSKVQESSHVFYTAVLPMLVTSLLLIIIGYLLADPIASLLTYPGRGYYVMWFSWIIALDVLALLPMARLRLESKARYFVMFKVFNVVITILLVLFFLEILPRMESNIVATVLPFIKSDIDFVFLSNLIASGAMVIGLNVIYPLKFKKIDWTLWLKMVRYAWPLIIVGIAGSINQFFGVPLQKYFLGADYNVNKDEAAIYGAVQKIPALLAMFTTAYNYAAEPFFFRNSDRHDAKKLYGDIALFFVMAAGVMVLSIFLYIDTFQFLIGPTFRAGLYLVPILLLSYLFLGIYYNVSIWYKLSDKTIYGAVIASIGAVITIVGSITFLPILGVEASAYSALACYVTMVLLAYLIGQKKYPIDYPVAKILLFVLLIMAIMYLGWIFQTSSFVINLIIGTAFILLYLTVCFLLERDRIKEYFGI